MARGEKILVVEDDEILAELIQIILAERNYQVTSVNDAETAWQALHSGPTPDLVLLDRGLPDMDGLQLLQRIKADLALCKLPVVLQTGRDDLASVTEGLAAGAYYYLTKPLQPALVLAVIEAALEQQRQVTAMQATLTDTGQTLQLMESGTFRFRTVAEARALAQNLARACPDPGRALLGLQELMINAVEHGNYGLTYAEKSRLLAENGWHEELARRAQDPACNERRATVHLSRTAAQLNLTIQDEGDGFDWHAYLDFSPKRAFDLHGRGIAMARLTSFDTLDYLGNGNTVRVTVNLPSSTDLATASGHATPPSPDVDTA